MPQQAATIESLPMAFEVVKAMQADGLDWGEGYRPLGRQAIAEILEDRMSAAIGKVREGRQVREGRPVVVAVGRCNEPPAQPHGQAVSLHQPHDGSEFIGGASGLYAVLKDRLSSAIEGLRDRDLEAAVAQLEALSKLRRD